MHRGEVVAIKFLHFGNQQPYRSIPAFTRKPLLHPEVAKETENRN